jgi:60 kDa SS-A/Ro ribonucleoprotein
MANKNLFGTMQGKAPVATGVNRAGGKAYEFTPRHTLAQVAATNTFNGTFYASAEENLKLAQEAVKNVKNDPEFIAKVAVYSRDKAYMKDMPAFLVATLACLDDGKSADTHDRSLFHRTFRKVIDNGKMLRNFVQIGRSGTAGKKLNMSSGAVRSALQEWFDSKSPEAIFRASVGNDPSLKDILKMARPRPEAKSAKAALYAYLTDTPFNEENQCFEHKRKGKDGALFVSHSDPWENLPEVVRAFNLYKKHPVGNPPNVEFRLLTSLELGTEQWTEIARNAGWMMTRMNLQTFDRHGVFKDKEMIKLIADRLRNPEEVAKARAFPYQLLMTYTATDSVPPEIREALQDAMELATDNVPIIEGEVVIAVDVSASMKSSITGYRPGATSAMRCVDVAALFAATIVRKNKLAAVYPFDTSVHSVTGHDILNPRDSVMTNAHKLAKYGGGGTNCSLVLEQLNKREVREVRNVRAVITISDSESWIDSGPSYGYHGTGTMEAWKKFEKRNLDAKLINIDLTPRNNSQMSPQSNILQVGGWSDEAFTVIKSFIDHGNDPEHWVKEIEKVEV